MKTIGLIGGMSWESSQLYYQIINETVRGKLGGLHSAKSLMFSFDFYEIEELQHAGNWDAATKLMVKAAQDLEKGGADFVLICTNTMHKMANEVASQIAIPLLHIAEPTAQAIKAKGIKKIGLLGTKFTMEQDFYKGWLQNAGLEVVVPNEADRQIVHSVIYDELCQGVVKDTSRQEYSRIIDGLKAEGAEGVILGCTEITMLVKQKDSSLPVFDTTRIHAEVAAEQAIQG
ncbi:MAG TPA: aspartate/glutamate racemase family protein [Candidatus Saccharimonadales bacterium]|nr:aspartate/glutamate racemase family protein [Candidatus Saccharimonadales bacterium]